MRSPIDYVRQIAESGVPLQIWWSWNDRIVLNQATQSGLLYSEVEKVAPRAPVAELIGRWGHTREMYWYARLPGALGLFGLMPPYGSHAEGLALQAPAAVRPPMPSLR